MIYCINKRAAPGIDGITMPKYKEALVENLTRLSSALKAKSYRSDDIKRVFIPKSHGKQRPLGLPTVDDKLVQQSVSQILQSIWEVDFLPNSYGYRPNKSAHQAVHSVSLNLQFKGYGYIVEADIKGFFDNIDHNWLMEMLKQRIDDNTLLRLIGQWLKARIKSPEGDYIKPQSGTPQGGIISPVLANIYLHYALDLWFEKKVKPRMSIDAKGNPRLRRRTASQKQRSSLSEFYHFIKAKRSHKLAIWLPQLKRKLTGFRNYFGLPDNSRSLSKLYNYVLHSLYKWLNRRSGRRSYNWSNFKKMLEYFQIQKLRVSKRVIHVDWY